MWTLLKSVDVNKGKTLKGLVIVLLVMSLDFVNFSNYSCFSFLVITVWSVETRLPLLPHWAAASMSGTREWQHVES